MSKQDRSIDEKRLALAIHAVEQFAGKTWKTLSVQARAEAICRIYEIADDDVPAIELAHTLQGILGREEGK